MNKYTPVIGLEVHVELKTKSKMFCGCSTEYFGKEPNTHTCPVCLGLPGALPVPNKKAIEWCVMIGMALNCKIPLISKFDRKNYFYPDLAKGYQISQYDQPFAEKGHIVLSDKKLIRIRRVHMEEDTAKLTHHGGSAWYTKDEELTGILESNPPPKVSFIDFNRSGVPLVEIVTEPDFQSAIEVKEYLQKLQQIVRYLDVSNADMEKGEMRLEPNISLRSHPGVATTTIGSPAVDSIASLQNDELPKYKVEVKNINSFKFVEKAIAYELKRQEKILVEGKIPVQETRGWDEDRQKTFSQRLKEEAQDYRYFPDPDIPPIRWTGEQLSSLIALVPELPDKKVARFETEYGLTFYDAEILCREKNMADYFENAVRNNKERVEPKAIANWIINKKVNINKVKPGDLVKQIAGAKTRVVIDEDELQKIIGQVIKEHGKAVEDYKKGKEASIMFLVGQTMRKIGKKVDATIVRKTIESSLK